MEFNFINLNETSNKSSIKKNADKKNVVESFKLPSYKDFFGIYENEDKNIKCLNGRYKLIKVNEDGQSCKCQKYFDGPNCENRYLENTVRCSYECHHEVIIYLFLISLFCYIVFLKDM